jgi:pyruvate kinase
MDFEYIAVSFAERVSQIKDVRRLLHPKKIRIISKIETKKGIININDLIRVSDGIMVARGDLGKNIPFEEVPLFQKWIIKRCNQKKKMVITATEMLLSMTSHKIPERSEVSDIANAVLDGSDAVMLSEETAIGKYPALAVKTMNKVIKATENKKKLLK